MSKLAIIALKAVGGTALFAVSFVGFAKINGVPMHSLPGVGGMFAEDPKPGESSEEAAAHEVDPAHALAEGGEKHETPAAETPHAEHPAEAVVEAPPPHQEPVHAGVFRMLDAEGLYTPDELRALADSLRSKNHEADRRRAELDRREELLADRLTALDDRRRVMDDVAKQLDGRERELKAREAEASSDATNAAAGQNLPSADLSAFFTEGDTEVLVQRLTGFTAAEGAEILIRLPPTRAKELLEGIPNARWREYAEAYARAAQKPAH